tara:strand:+ start:35 stop:349 length:315 start_codon:yes stop_codon:yes gene_type:complete
VLDIKFVKIVLYTGPYCSLCDLAVEIVEQFNALYTDTNTINEPAFQPNSTDIISERVELEKINIRDSADLYHLYGARIPVLKREKTDSELGWPFTLDDLIEFLK